MKWRMKSLFLIFLPALFWFLNTVDCNPFVCQKCSHLSAIRPPGTFERSPPLSYFAPRGVRAEPLDGDCIRRVRCNRFSVPILLDILWLMKVHTSFQGHTVRFVQLVTLAMPRMEEHMKLNWELGNLHVVNLSTETSDSVFDAALC